jgi:FkbM family methyltransferase
LSAQVSELQAQISALKALVEQPQASASQVSNFQSQVSASSPATSHPLPVTAAPSPSAKPLPIYELKETHPVGYQSRDLLDSSSEESQDGFFTGLLDRARMQWLMGDWEGLGSLDSSEISRSPDRGKLILLAGCGALQSGNIQNFKRLLSAAKAAQVLPDLRKALLSSTFSVLAKAAQINGSNAKALRFERHAVAEMDKIGFLQGLRPPGRPQEALDDVSRKTLDSLEAMERKNKFAEMEIEGLRSQVETFKARAISQPAPSAPPTSAAPAPAAQPPAPSSAEKKYYGLDGLDRKLEVFLDFDNGYFVELGANDGVNQSNTFYFEQSRGWKGVLIEPVLHNFIKCKAARSPENFFQCAACVGFDYKEETLRLHYSNLLTTPTGISTDCPDPEAQARGGYQYIPAHERDIVIHAPARTLQSILLEAQAPRVIDLLSLDVEGGEMEVLQGIDHTRFQFRFLLVECRRIDKLQEFLAPKGYSLVEKLSFHDYLFQLKTA